MFLPYSALIFGNFRDLADLKKIGNLEKDKKKVTLIMRYTG